MQRRLYRYQAELARLAALAAEEEAAHDAEVARLQTRIQVTLLAMQSHDLSDAQQGGRDCSMQELHGDWGREQRGDSLLVTMGGLPDSACSSCLPTAS